MERGKMPGPQLRESSSARFQRRLETEHHAVFSVVQECEQGVKKLDRLFRPKATRHDHDGSRADGRSS